MRKAVLKPLLFVAGAAALAFSAARSADCRLVVEPAAPSTGDVIEVRLYQGPPFGDKELPVGAPGKVLFQRLWRNGRANLGASADGRSAARFRATEAGVQLIVYSDPGAGRFCKTLLVVGDPPANDPLRYSELGQRLEIVPQSDPVDLARGGGILELQVLFEREPLADARVEATPAADAREGTKVALTDEIGLVRLRLDRPGPWTVRVGHRHREESGGGESTLSATLTLHVASVAE